MNSDTMNAVEEILKATGATVPCSICGGYDIRAWDEHAESMAYGQATNAWKAVDRGSRNMSRVEVVSLVKGSLDSALKKCPACHA